MMSESKHQSIMREEDILEINQYWTKGVAISFPENPKPSPITADHLYNACWIDLTSAEIQGLRKYPFRINGVWRRIYLAGWQRFLNGFTVLHPEENGEDINLAHGRLIMASTDKERNAVTVDETGPIPKDQLHQVAFALCVGEDFRQPEASGMEHLALYTLANFRLPVPQLSIGDNYLHQAISIGEAWALVVKHERENLG